MFHKIIFKKLYDIVNMQMWCKMMHRFSYGHNIEHNRSKIRALHPKIIGINLSGA